MARQDASARKIQAADLESKRKRAEEWEVPVVSAGRLRERRAELALFAGLIG